MNVQKQQEEHLKRLILSLYEPAPTLAEADFSLNTIELFEKLNRSFPGIELSLDKTYQLMLELGFEMVEGGDMEFVWAVRLV